jgi:hypothetical protein
MSTNLDNLVEQAKGLPEQSKQVSWIRCLVWFVQVIPQPSKSHGSPSMNNALWGNELIRYRYRKI